jgi:hypothetical protein
MNCKLTNASAQQRDRQTFRESLRLINQVRGENLLTTHRLSVLYFLRDREQDIPTLLPLLTPPPRAPPETLPLYAGKDSRSTAFNQQGRH